MLAFLLIVLAQYCKGGDDTRESLFTAFLELYTKDDAKQFLKDCEKSTEFVCHVNENMDRACFDVYVHYFEVLDSALFQDCEMTSLMRLSGIYSEEAIQHMLIKSVNDDNTSLLAGAALLFKYPSTYEHFLSIELTVFEDGPEWTAFFNELSQEYNFLNYAIYRKSLRTFMMLYYFVGRRTNYVLRINENSFEQNGVEIGKLFPYLEQALPISECSFEFYIFDYFCSLSTTKFDIEDKLTLETIKEFAESYLDHYLLDSSNILFLLTRPNLEEFSTLEYLKGKIKDQVVAHSWDPHINALSDLNLYYENVDLVTGGEWALQWKHNLEINGYSDALWKSYRGAATSAHNVMVNSKLIFGYCTSSKSCRLVFNSLKGLTEEISENKYLGLLLHTNQFEYTLLALRVIKQMGHDDAMNVIEQARNTFVLRLSRSIQTGRGISTHIDQYVNYLLFNYVDDIINNRAVCGSCKKVININSDFRVLPCGHVVHSSDDVLKVLRCSICQQEYSFEDTAVIAGATPFRNFHWPSRKIQ